MRFPKILPVSVSMVMLLTAGQALAQCQDDERMYSIGNFLEAQRSGDAPPLQLTAETYLQLTPTAREAIGDNLNIFDANCKPMQVFQGEPPARVELPFPLIYNAFYDAVLRGDTQTQGVVLRSFRAAPVDAMEFLSLFSPIPVDVNVARQLAGAANIQISHSKHGAMQDVNCESTDPQYITYVDIFNRLGGRVKGRNGNAWFTVSTREAASVDYQTVSQMGTAGGCWQGIADLNSRIRGAGGLVINTEWGWSPSSTETSRIIETYEEWVKDGSPDSVPQSLFD